MPRICEICGQEELLEESSGEQLQDAQHLYLCESCIEDRQGAEF